MGPHLRRSARPLLIAIPFWLTLAGCGLGENVKSPTGISARFVTDELKVDVEGEKYNLGRTLGINAKLPIDTKFSWWDFKIVYQDAGEQGEANCCADIMVENVMLKLAVKDASAQDVDIRDFTTPSKPARIELLFLAPATVAEVTLLYKDQPASKVLKVKDWYKDHKGQSIKSD